MVGIPDNLMGDFWPDARPGSDDADYGSTSFSPAGSFPVRSLQTFTLVYTVGAFGLDDTGAIKIVNRWVGDGGSVQFDDPSGLNYVTATASNGVALELYAEPYPHQRPWYNGLRITLTGGYMSPGDTISIVFGDRSQGSPGYRLQTFSETECEFRVLADVCATGVFIPVSRHAICVTPGPVERWVLTAPSLQRTDKPFRLGIRAEDAWGNACDQSATTLHVTAAPAIAGLPDRVTLTSEKRGTRVEGLTAKEPGTYRFTLLSAEGAPLAHSNPMVVKDTGPMAFWGDLHGQSGETVGISPLRDYLEYARNVAFLDVTSHQANDFQVTNDFWQHINEVSAELNCDGAFVVFPGYEWSGNTPVGGDHNVFFAQEGQQIHRSSHALLPDRSDIGTDAHTVSDLFEALDGKDCVVYSHVGGRPADISKAENPRLRTAVEVHSDWGTFEWILTDAFDLGYRVGVVCNSDGHKGAPGACYPGASEFGAYSGLTCFLAGDLTREAIFTAMRQRRHYGTTGCRMHMEVTAHLGEKGAVYPIDPRIEPRAPIAAATASMGDIVRVDGDHIDLEIAIETHAPIERVDILNAAETVATLRPHDLEKNTRLRVIWQGAEYRGRGRTTHWKGTLDFDRAKIRRINEINIWNPERRFTVTGNRTVTFDAVTTGNFGGCDIWLEEEAGALSIDTDLVSGDIDLSQITGDDTVFEAGGLDRKMRVFRLPDHMDVCRLHETVSVSLEPGRDNPLWIRVTTEDGFNAWSSPIYVTR
ncbi:MAG: DUF3604 domain-containing protein [Roseobacter sp.]